MEMEYLKEKLNEETKYDDFEIMELHIVSKNLQTGEKLDIFGGYDYIEKEPMKPVFVKQVLESKSTCKSIDDLIRILEKIKQQYPDLKLGDSRIDVEDENGVLKKKLYVDSICNVDKCDMFDIRDVYYE